MVHIKRNFRKGAGLLQLAHRTPFTRLAETVARPTNWFPARITRSSRLFLNLCRPAFTANASLGPSRFFTTSRAYNWDTHNVSPSETRSARPQSWGKISVSIHLEQLPHVTNVATKDV